MRLKIRLFEYSRLQILIIKELLNNLAKLEYPGSIKDVTFKQVERKTKEGNPGELF